MEDSHSLLEENLWCLIISLIRFFLFNKIGLSKDHSAPINSALVCTRLVLIPRPKQGSGKGEEIV